MKYLFTFIFWTSLSLASGQNENYFPPDYYANLGERIISYNVNIDIEQSGDIEVTEDITIKAEGDKFKRGLFRSLPLKRNDKGYTTRMKYKLNTILKDGQKEKYFTEKENGYLHIYIGEEDKFLTEGEYTYSINYAVDDQLGFFDAYDELYWNVTGTEWDFLIQSVTCSVNIPARGGEFGNYQCYTGSSGSTESKCNGEIKSGGKTITFIATDLLPNQGLTIAVAFPKEVVDEPFFSKHKFEWYHSSKLPFWSIIFGIGAPLFFFLNWKKHGKDPRKNVTIPEFHPPFGWSPALVGYAYERKLNDRIYMASMVNTAVKGGIKIISETKRKFLRNKTEYAVEVFERHFPTLCIEENEIKSNLYTRGILEVNDSNYRKFMNAHNSWSKSVKNQVDLKELYENNNDKKAYGCIVYLILGLAFTLLATIDRMEHAKPLVILISIITAGAYWTTKKPGLGASLLLFIIGFIVVPLSFFLAPSLVQDKDPIAFAILGVMFISFLVYAIFLGKYTKKGEEIKRKLEGFRMYLRTAEEDKINILNPPERTPELFEQLLPYAIALDCEVEWGAKFEKILDRARYNPAWNEGSKPFDYHQPSSFMSSFDSKLSNSRTDPSPPSSSSGGSSRSSGSSGGGSSGGGGGGGGGGGW